MVTIDAGRIFAVGREPDGCKAIDLGDVALLPGLVNPHTHLEFSDCEAPLGAPGMPFPRWVPEVIQWRAGQIAGKPAVPRGLDESAQAGVTTLGEIATPGWSPAAFGNRPPRATVFLEAIGLARSLVDQKLAEAHEHLQRAAGQRHWRPGLSPHAPYTVRPELFERLVDLASGAGVPVAFHLAESQEEIELLATGGGRFRDVLSELGVWDSTAIPRGTRPLDYLRRLADRRVRALVIHGNYLDDEEIGVLAKHADRLTVVYCPRTHAYFQHRRHPLPRLLAAGARVAVGTDSRASNPDLNLWEELRFILRAFPELSPEAVLRMGTIDAAWALGEGDVIGSLEVGKRADLTIVPLEGGELRDPYEGLFHAPRALPHLFAGA
ncbi:MAG TPA: amidohydrolase family protein [Pirellulales bacterium]|nr:amidohydrolase family protein [Pirellulales bacterium]